MAPEGTTGGELAAGALRALGAEVLFTLPGSHIGHLLDRVRQGGAKAISVRHEENAILMAEGWALATGSTGFAIVTAGPGLANALPGIVEANSAGAPLLVLAGRTAISKRGRGAVQDLGQLRAVAGVTKWSAECLEPSRVAEYVVEAYRQASWGSPGVAYLEIPEDVLEASTPDAAPPGLPPVYRPVPEEAGLERAIGLLRGAERPLLVAGSGAFFSRAEGALLTFAQRTGIPVTTTSAARGLLDDDNPLCLGSLVHGGAVLVSADLALVVGSRFNANLMYGRPPLFGEEQVVIQVDLRSENLGGPRTPTLGLVGDAGATLEALARAWPREPDRWQSWRDQAQRTAAMSREVWSAEADQEAEGISAGWLARQVASAFERRGGGTWVSDGGDSVTWGIAFSKAHRPGSNMLIGSAMGTLGVGLPFAIAAGVARPGQPLILFTGDGGFGFSAMELHTAARQRVGMIIVVVNNGVWRGPGSSSSEPQADFDYAALALAVGGSGIRISAKGELEDALQEAFQVADSGRPCVLDVKCDPRVVSALLRGVDELGLM